MPARTRSFVPAIASACAIIALLALALSALAAPPAAAPQAPSGSLNLVVNYSHDWVNGHTLPLAHVEVTVKHAGQIATLNVEANANGDFNSNDGTWSPARPDIAPGDVIEANAAGATASINPVGEIAGTLDAAHSRVSGEIIAPLLAANLTVKCEVWVEGGGPVIVQSGVPANHGAFTCDFGAQGHTLPPGTAIAVIYFEPDLDQVIRVFRMPGPDVAVDSWPEGNRETHAGGRSIFNVVYRNDGDAPAEDVLLTDTLPTGVTYIASTFDTEPAVVGSTRQWSLGTLAPGTQKHVFVVLQNALEPGQSFQNVVDISTTSQGDDTGNNHRVSDPVQVTSNLPDVNVGQWVNPGDVLAGDSYRVVVNYGNNGPVPAGPVHLTVQLDPTVALVDWVSENGYRGLWKMTQGAAGAFLFEAPALPGFWGDKLLLRVNVPSSMPADKELVSTVSIGAPLDPNAGNDGPFSQSARVTQSQRPDLHVDKRWGYGQLVKGGRAFYQLNYSNDGNLTQQHVLLTDTLPAGTTFVAATVDSNWGQSTPRPPLSNVDGKATWDLDTLAPGEWGNLKVEVALDHIEPGSTITNKADITGPDNDRSWWNNHSTVVEQVNAAGPNLRVRSESSWESREEVRFEIYFENIGTTTIEDVQITDTLPEGLEFGNWGTNFWQPMNGGNYDPATRKITWTIDRLEPGWTSSINIGARVPAADHDKQGLVFENAAQITSPPGEVTPADNSTTVTAFTGPDLFIEKSLWSGKVAAGELVTFSITVGNRNNGPWNTGDHPKESPGIEIVDTLPAGMTFVRAYAGPDEWKPDQQVGNVLTWHAYGMCAGCRWQFLVEARIAATLPGGSPLTNTAEITDLVAGDVDPFSANNQSSWQGTVDKRRTYLPVLMR